MNFLIQTILYIRMIIFFFTMKSYRCLLSQVCLISEFTFGVLEYVEFLFDKTKLKFINHEKSIFESFGYFNFLLYQPNSFKYDVKTQQRRNFDYLSINNCFFFFSNLIFRFHKNLSIFSIFFWLVGGGGMLLVGFWKSCVSLLFSFVYYKFGSSYIHRIRFAYILFFLDSIDRN